MPRASIRWAAVALLGLILPTASAAAPRDAARRLDPRQVSPLPSQVRRVEPAVVGIRVEVPRDRPSTATLGVERWGSGVIVQLNGRQVASREEFYRELWQSPMDQDVRVTVRRAGGMEAITVRPMDRYRFYRTSDK